MSELQLRVGELAKRTGLTVRALHHYDDLGLLRPKVRSESGHRLYGESDLARLQSILSLRALGLRLDEIARALESPGFSPKELIRLQMDRLTVEIAAREELRSKLARLSAAFDGADELSVEELVEIIKEIAMMEKYYSPEQLAELSKRAEELGPDGMKKAESDWAELIAEVTSAVERGVSPRSEEAKALAGRWMSLISAFTGGNPDISQGLNSMWQNEKEVHGMQVEPMSKLMSFVQEALKS